MLRKVQKGEFTMTGTSENVNIDIVDLDKSFLLFTGRAAGGNLSDYMLRGWMSSSSQLSFSRTSNNQDAFIKWRVIEFDERITVQRGNTGSLSSGTNNIALSTPVDLNTSFPIVSYENTGSTFGQNDHMRAEITSPTNLAISFTDQAVTNVAWQVVDLKTCRIQKKTGSYNTQNPTISIDPVDLRRTIVFGSMDTSADTGGDDTYSIFFRDSSTIELYRYASATTVAHDVCLYVVSFFNNVKVQHRTATIPSGNTSVDINIDCVNEGNNTIWPELWWGFNTANDATDDAGLFLFVGENTDCTTLRFTRNSTGAEARIGCQIVEWDAGRKRMQTINVQ